ncbi:MAG: UDP-N-acetylmuramate dehydrogenase [Treponema sp.]|nr:UDP-N-acetylmuramate dehydrogenase [Treponema sp.]
MSDNKIRLLIEECLKKYPCKIEVRYNEPMKEHTTFKVGGPADCWIQGSDNNFPYFCAEFLYCTRKERINVFILGGGANIVVSDKGIRGVVLDMCAWKSPHKSEGICLNSEEEFVLRSGTSIDKACEAALCTGFSGFEFLAGMPGTIGGAVWMNARCYGSEISDTLSWTEVIAGQDSGKYELRKIYTSAAAGFGYKQSPFQKVDCLILSAAFKLKKGDKEIIKSEMKKNRQDRNNKGHYLFPCAGSVFKNNHEFGKPAGAIIDELGLKGLKKGGAQVAPFHGNIIINTGGASAENIRMLTQEIALTVKEKTGFILEPEILFVGEWGGV